MPPERLRPQKALPLTSEGPVQGRVRRSLVEGSSVKRIYRRPRSSLHPQYSSQSGSLRSFQQRDLQWALVASPNRHENTSTAPPAFLALIPDPKMSQSPADIFGGLPYPEFPHMLFACFPLLVLVVCVHVVGADSGAPGMLGVCIGAVSALLQSTRSGISSLLSGGPRGALRAIRQRPALLLLVAPLVSFCCFRLLPLLLRSDAVAAGDVCLSGSRAFVPLDIEGLSSSGPVGVGSIVADLQQVDLRLLLHAFYFSSSSVVVWLFLAPLVLYSAALLLQQAHQQQQRRPGVEQSLGSWGDFALQLLVALPLLSGLLLVLFLYLADYEDVCISGFLPLLFSLNFLAFVADPVSLLLLRLLLLSPLHSVLVPLWGWKGGSHCCIQAVRLKA